MRAKVNLQARGIPGGADSRPHSNFDGISPRGAGMPSFPFFFQPAGGRRSRCEAPTPTEISKGLTDRTDNHSSSLKLQWGEEPQLIVVDDLPQVVQQSRCGRRSDMAIFHVTHDTHEHAQVHGQTASILITYYGIIHVSPRSIPYIPLPEIRLRLATPLLAIH